MFCRISNKFKQRYAKHLLHLRVVYGTLNLYRQRSNDAYSILTDSVFCLWKPAGTKDSSSGKPRARGVEFMDGHGRSYQVFLNETSHSSEVILTAGALGSPQLLLLSGIGPSEHLREFNIPLVLHSPSVGQRVQDNPLATVGLQSPIPLEFSSIQVVGILKGSQTYIESSSFVRQASASINGSASPHLKNVSIGGIFEKLAFPLSRGELKLRNSDPRDNPSIRYYWKNVITRRSALDSQSTRRKSPRVGNIVQSNLFQKLSC